MSNKLGLNGEAIQEVEEKLVEYKSKLVDYRFTFGVAEFGITYLFRLNEFLFGDLYYDAGRMSKRYQEKDKLVIDRKIKYIVELIKMKDPDVDNIAYLINDLIDDQIFDDGNSRTIHLLFETVINCYHSVNDDYAVALKEAIKRNSRRI